MNHAKTNSFRKSRWNLWRMTAMLFVLLFVHLSTQAKDIESVQQQKMYTIKGVILDDKTNEPIIGANVKVIGTSLGTVTDLDGNYQLKVPSSATKIEFSYIGYKKLEVSFYPDKLNDFRVINLQEDSQTLGEVTVVAFSKQKKESVISSISTIKPAELKVPSSNLTTALAGRVAGLISYQRSGEPGKDNADLFVRAR